MSDCHHPDGAPVSPLGDHLAQRLRAAGTQRLPAVFMFPVGTNGARQWCRYPAIMQVSWRERSKPFYIRSPAVPFDILPLRPKDPARIGSWYSLGPGLDGGTLLEHVLLVQVVGEEAEVTQRRQLILSLVEQACAESPGERMQVRVRAEAMGESGRPEWMSYCLAATLMRGGES